MGCLLAFVSGAAYYERQVVKKRMSEMELLVSELQKKERQSAIIENVSRQMEEIAYQQKSISEEQRLEAIRQKQEADAAKELAERQRQEAESQRQEADRQRQEADRQRQVADRQRQEAEYAKRVADTLSYIALGRSLASISTMQRQGGNTEVANLLAYASYMFTKRYGDDDMNLLYNPTVVQSLIEASQSKHSWSVHNGILTEIDFLDGSDTELVSVSNYGEIFKHEKQGSQLKSNKIFSNKEYDFRSIYVSPEGSVFAVSRTGHLVVVDKDVSIIEIKAITHPMRVVSFGNDTIVVVGENGMAYFNEKTYKQIDTQILDYTISTAIRLYNHPVLFDKSGNMYELFSRTKMEKKKLLFMNDGYVTAYTRTPDSSTEVFGTSDGHIFVVDKSGNIKEFLGHRSRISRLKFFDDCLYSTSYDGTMNMWMYKADKVEPMQLLNTGNWIMYFTNDYSKKYVWTGDQNGNLTETLLSIDEMEKLIRKNLNRDLTHDEWNYFIGKDIPYESFLGKGKETRR